MSQQSEVDLSRRTSVAIYPGTGALVDMASLFLLGQLVGADRVIGIVPHEWFVYHPFGSSTAGVSFRWIPVAIVTDGLPLVTAHELGHTYNFDDSYIVAGIPPFTTRCILNGASVGAADHATWDGKQFTRLGCLEIECTLDFIAAANPKWKTKPFADYATQRWTTPDEFAELFRQLRANPPDPPLLLVTGTILQDGSASFDRMYRSPGGIPSPSVADGRGSIQLLDRNGAIVAQLSFPLDFTALTDPPITLAEAPFAFALPDLPIAAYGQILRNGQPAATVSIAGKLLRDAVSSLPENGFLMNAYREEMHY